MIRALGFSQEMFNPSRPGRLCRGRERWIEPYPLEPEPERVHRLVLTGATFSDDSARDAQRGLHHSGIELAQVLAILFPRKALLAFTEDGHPADLPEQAEGIEAYLGFRAGGHSRETLVRWHQEVSGLRELRALLGDDPRAETVRGFVTLAGGEDLDLLLDKLFLLTGMSTLDSPPARFQPAALPEVLELVRAVVLLHRDKHGTAVGVYSREAVRAEGRIEALCDKHGVLQVPFAIPPMLARWDRALSELRQSWVESRDDEFPVPPASEPSTWEPRRRSRRGRKSSQPKPSEE